MEYDKVHSHSKEMKFNHAYLDKILHDLDKDIDESGEI